MGYRGRREHGGTIRRMLQTGVDGGLIWDSAREMERSGLGSVSLFFRCMIHADVTSPGAEAPRVMRMGPLNLVYRAVLMQGFGLSLAGRKE